MTARSATRSKIRARPRHRRALASSPSRGCIAVCVSGQERRVWKRLRRGPGRPFLRTGQKTTVELAPLRRSCRATVSPTPKRSQRLAITTFY